MAEHARFALSHGVPKASLQRNGDLIRLAPGGPEKLTEVRVGRLVLDGDVILPADGTTITVPASSGRGVNPGIHPRFEVLCSGPQGAQSAAVYSTLTGLVIQTLPAGSFVNCAVSSKVTGAAGSDARITVAAALPNGFYDPNPANNTATDALPIK